MEVNLGEEEEGESPAPRTLSPPEPPPNSFMAVALSGCDRSVVIDFGRGRRRSRMVRERSEVEVYTEPLGT